MNRRLTREVRQPSAFFTVGREQYGALAFAIGRLQEVGVAALVALAVLRTCCVDVVSACRESEGG